MASNIDIQKKCEWCGVIFTAHKTSTAYCSHRCANLAYKERVRKKRVPYYIFDRGYNDFSHLFNIEQIDATFVVRAKKNLKFKQVSWKRRLPKNVLSDSTIEFTVYKSSKDYPIPLRRVAYYDEE